jgi:hypothetical protein
MEAEERMDREIRVPYQRSKSADERLVKEIVSKVSKAVTKQFELKIESATELIQSDLLSSTEEILEQAIISA